MVESQTQTQAEAPAQKPQAFLYFQVVREAKAMIPFDLKCPDCDTENTDKAVLFTPKIPRPDDDSLPAFEKKALAVVQCGKCPCLFSSWES